MNNPRVLLVHNYPMRFVDIDRQILSQHYCTTELYLKSKCVNPFSILHHVGTHDIVFAWFASWHSLLPLLFARLLAKPSILIIGGYDVTRMPEIGYGHQRGGLKKWVSRAAIYLATQLVTFSHYGQDQAVENVGLCGTGIVVIYPGFDPGLFPYSSDKEVLAVSVGNVMWENLARKGLEPFVRAGQHLPDVPFVLIGRWRDRAAAERLRTIAPPNVTLTGYVSDEELVGYLRWAKVYVQASAHEGFGLAVAEAMLCGCVPVVTRAGALPEVVGDTGVYLDSRAPEDVAQGVRKALRLAGSHGRQARERIICEFPLENRRRALCALVDRLLEEA